MKYLLLLLFTCSLAQSIENRLITTSKAKVFFKIRKTQQILTDRNFLIYKKSLTGDKSILPKKIKSAFQRYGLYHLLTPSGLHLSSLFFINILPIAAQIIILLSIFIIILPMHSYLSLERILIFKTIFNITSSFGLRLNQELILLATIILSVFVGNFQQSPMSFMFSILFWGTILIYKSNKFQMLIFLNVSQHLIGLLLNQPINIISIIVNPIYTFSFVSIFPFFLINQLIGEMNLLTTLINIFIESWLDSLLWILDHDFIGTARFSIYPLIITTVFLNHRKYKSALIFITLMASEVSSHGSRISPHKDFIINIGHRGEVLKKNTKVGQKVTYTFIDQKCVFRKSQFFCKKKPSKYGGPIF